MPDRQESLAGFGLLRPGLAAQNGCSEGFFFFFGKAASQVESYTLYSILMINRGFQGVKPAKSLVVVDYGVPICISTEY